MLLDKLNKEGTVKLEFPSSSSSSVLFPDGPFKLILVSEEESRSPYNGADDGPVPVLPTLVLKLILCVLSLVALVIVVNVEDKLDAPEENG